jgi:hypothetical protein
MSDKERKQRNDIGKKRGKYIFQKDKDWVGVMRYCAKMRIKLDLDIDEVRFFMTHECYCCGGDSYGILPLGGDIINHTNAVVLCSKCYRPAQTMGIEKFIIHSHKVSAYSNGINLRANTTIQQIHNPAAKN